MLSLPCPLLKSAVPCEHTLAGLYCSGWVKTGPVGVILTTMSNAFETAEAIVEDYKQGTCIYMYAYRTLWKITVMMYSTFE